MRIIGDYPLALHYLGAWHGAIDHGMEVWPLITSKACAMWRKVAHDAERSCSALCRTLATNSERVLSALWGKLAAEILMQQWETALDDIQKLRDIIDGNTFAPILQQLQQRVWLMHWSLFVFFEHENGRNAIIDLFFQDR